MDASKKLIVTDYDGTLKNRSFPEDFKKSIGIINELGKYHTSFAISSGRTFDSLSKEVEENGIIVNYLSCANGNALYNAYYDLLWKQTVRKEVLEDLKECYGVINSIEAKDEYGQPTSKNPMEYLIHLEEDKKNRRKVVDMLLDKSDKYDYCTDGSSKYLIHIFNSSDKTKTIEKLQKLDEYDDDDIYTVGDGTNDINMINKYNGYVVGDKLTKDQADYLTRYDKFSSFMEAATENNLEQRGRSHGR